MGQKFQYPQYLHLLWLLIPIVVLVIFHYRWREQSIARIFGKTLQNKVIPHRSSFMINLRWLFALLAFIFLCLGIANPQIGVKEEKIKGKGIDVMIILDVSNSMLAQDIQPNRLERSKLFISKLLDQMSNDRAGLVIFAGSSFLQVPLTIDYSAIKMNLPLIDPSSIPSQGTNIGEAVIMAQRSLGLTDSKHKAIVLLTDGEDHDKEAETAIAEAKKNGIRVFAIGAGTETGANIPMNGDVKRDEDGTPIVTKINPKMLTNLASIGNGSYYELGMQGSINEEVMAGLRQIEQREFEDIDFSNYNSYFFWFLLIALYLIFFEYVWPSVKISAFYHRIFPILIAGIMLSPLQAQTKPEKEQKEQSQNLIRRGNVQYQHKKYDEAEINYRKSLAKNPKNATANYNLGNALYEQKKYQEAAESLEKAKGKLSDKISKAKNFHNLGNAYFKQGNMEKAIENYENALKNNPSDMDTKINLALAKKKKKDQGGGGNNQQNQNKDQQNQNQQNQAQNGQEKPQQEGDQPKQEPKPRPGQMTKEQAQNLLEMLRNQEQNTQRKVDQQKQKPDQKKSEKDW